MPDPEEPDNLTCHPTRFEFPISFRRITFLLLHESMHLYQHCLMLVLISEVTALLQHPRDE